MSLYFILWVMYSKKVDEIRRIARSWQKIRGRSRASERGSTCCGDDDSWVTVNCPNKNVTPPLLFFRTKVPELPRSPRFETKRRLLYRRIRRRSHSQISGNPVARVSGTIIVICISAGAPPLHTMRWTTINETTGDAASVPKAGLRGHSRKEIKRA